MLLILSSKNCSYLYRKLKGHLVPRSSQQNTKRNIYAVQYFTLSFPRSISICTSVMLKNKTIDRVEWAFLFTALSRFQFGNSFCREKEVLYSCLSAAISTDGVMSQFFNISKFTHQGCSLSSQGACPLCERPGFKTQASTFFFKLPPRNK